MLFVLVAVFIQVPAPRPVAIDGDPVVVWFQGDVTRAPSGSVAGPPGAPRLIGPAQTSGPQAPLIGEVLTEPTRVDAGTGGQLRLLVAGHQLLLLDGPGAWQIGSGQVVTLDAAGFPAREPTPAGTAPASRPPRVEPLTGFREGPLPLLEPISSQPLLDDLTLSPSLTLTSPIVPVIRTDRPAIRWYWPYPLGAFDLIIEEVDSEGRSLRRIERWQNVQGRDHTLWNPLDRGRRYRVRITHRVEGGLSPIADQRTFHVLAGSEIAAVDGSLDRLDELQRSSIAYRPELDVLRARLLESHGLWDEAETVWTGLTLLFPGRDTLLHQALRLRAKSMER